MSFDKKGRSDEKREREGDKERNSSGRKRACGAFIETREKRIAA